MLRLTAEKIQNLKRIYALALAFIALTLVASSLLLQYAIHQGQSDSRIINLSGRQRMLSQRLTKGVLTLAVSRPAEEQVRAIEELRQSLADWKQAESGLQHGDRQLGLPAREPSAPIRTLFAQIEPFYSRMVAAVTRLLAAADHKRLSPELVQTTVDAILVEAPQFLSLMDKITFQFDKESSARLVSLQYLDTGILAFGLLVLFLEYRFVFRPTVARMTGLLASLRRQGEQLQETNGRLQTALEESMRLAELAKAADKAKSEFLARMSHEIRTPLNAVIGMCHLALKTSLNARQFDYLSKIRLSADTLLAVINDILDFSKIEAGKLAIDRTPFSLDAVLEGVVDITSLAAEEKQLEFLLSEGEDVPSGLVGDPIRLGQVLLNLVNNAIKFTETGEVLLQVRLEEKSVDHARLRFGVRDTGIGLTPQQQTNLFQPFSQADGSITRRYGGTGLGLSISSRLVELMGGRLTMESRFGEGSEFSFSLDFPLSEIPKPPCLVEAAALEGLGVLVVDDNATSRQILSDILHSFRFTVLTVDSGEQALRVLERGENDIRVVLLDWKMPGMDGMTCAKRIRAMPLPHSPAIVVVTAYGREEVQREAENVGVAAFLLKPVGRSVLFNTIASVVGLSAVAVPASDCRSGGEEEAVLAAYRGARVLVVEDHAINQQIARELLEGAGLAVVMADDGEQALRLLDEQGPFAAVLMDVQMPVMDGLEATRRIRAQPRFADLPVIAMTAHAMAQDREKSLAAGMNDHVNKPIDPAALFATLATWLGRGERLPPDGARGARSCPEDVAGRLEPVGPAQDGDGIASAEAQGAAGRLEPVRLDSRRGLDRLRGNTVLYRRLLGEFVQQYPQTPGQIAARLAANDGPGARRLVHTLKGVAGNLGVMTVFEAALTLETCLDEHQDMACPAAVARLDQALAAARTAIETFLGVGEATDGQPARGEDYPLAALLPEMDDLLGLLAQNDSQALDVIDRLAASLARFFPEQTNLLAGALHRLDFRTARKQAVALRQRLADQAAPQGV